MQDLTAQQQKDIETAGRGDVKLGALLRQAMAEFDLTGSIGPVKERRIKKRLQTVKRRAARGH